MNPKETKRAFEILATIIGEERLGQCKDCFNIFGTEELLNAKCSNCGRVLYEDGLVLRVSPIELKEPQNF